MDGLEDEILSNIFILKPGNSSKKSGYVANLDVDAELDNLLQNYAKTPFISKECVISECDNDGLGEIVYGLKEKLDARLKDNYSNLIDHLIEGALLPIYECVQNIYQHCEDKGEIRFYLGDGSILGLFELSDELRIGTKALSDYKESLKRISNELMTGKHENRFQSWWDDLEAGEKELEFFLGTTLVFRNPQISKIGITVDEGRAFFFFEYMINGRVKGNY